METTTLVPIETQQKNAVKWIEALLSDKYKQGVGRLGNPVDGFCCWGLGCEIIGKTYDPLSGWLEEFKLDIGFKGGRGRISTDNILSDEIKKYTEHNDFNLMDINDKGLGTFPEIGDLLIRYADNAFIPEVASYITEHFKNNK